MLSERIREEAEPMVCDAQLTAGNIVRISMHDYMSLRVAGVIYATMVNTQTHTQRETAILLAQPDEPKNKTVFITCSFASRGGRGVKHCTPKLGQQSVSACPVSVSANQVLAKLRLRP